MCDKFLEMMKDVNWIKNVWFSGEGHFHLNELPNSPDLNPLDYFLWGYCKENVYKNKPRTLENLKSEVEKIVSEISRDTLKKVTSNLATRLNFVIEKNGSHIEHVMH
jgi:hypothetical protein